MSQPPSGHLAPTVDPYDSAQIGNVLSAVREMAHPTQIGPYHIQRVLGEGGMGTVYLAEQREPVRREVAVKLVKLGMDTRQVVARFESERQALALMNHPNVAKVLDAGATDNGRPYFVMEYVPGEPITAFADRHKLTVAQRLELFIQACEAVQHAHQKAIIHRDLKPSNVLVCFQDGKPWVKVIDFGVSKALNQRLTEKTLFTEHGQLLGTPEYMSPEQAESNALDVDTRADVYSLGVVLYELLSGALPFDVRSLRSAGYHEIQRIIREVDPPSPSTKLSSLQGTLPTIAAARQLQPAKLGSTLRGELDWIVMKALEKDRARRYESAGALVEDVARYLRDEPVAAGPPSRVYRARKFIRRHKWGIGMGVCIAVALAAGLAGTTWGLIDARRQRNDAIAARKSEAAAREYETQTDKFLIEMFTSIKPEESRGREMLVRELLDKAAARIDSEPPTHKIVEAYLRKIFGEAYHAIGLLEPAERHLQKSRELDSGADKVSVLRQASTLNVLGLVWRDLGKLDDAETALREAVRLHTATSGADDVETIAATANLGTVLAAHQKFAEADTILTEAVERARSVPGVDPFARAIAVNNLANLRVQQGHYEEAEGIYRAALDDSLKAYGEDHPASLGLMNNLAELLRMAGQFKEAVEMHARSYELSKEVNGSDHPSTLTCANNLALTLQLAGRLDEALPIYQDSIERSRQTLGEDHLATLNKRSNYALLLQNQGRFDEADAIFRDVLERQMRTVGPANLETLTTRNNIAWLQAIRGDLAGAEQLFRQIVPEARRSLAPDNPNIAFLSLRLGFVLAQQKKWTEAEPLLSSSLETGKQMGITSISPGYKVAMGVCLANLDRAEEARLWLDEAEKAIPPGAERALPKPLAMALAETYERLGQPEKASRWRAPATQPSTQPG